MTEPDKQTVQTKYGPTTVKTYDCDSCGNTVAYENTVNFTIGEREGRACQHCENDGPISSPEKIREFTVPSDPDNNAPSFDLVIILAPLIIPIYTFLGLAGKSGFDEGFAAAVLSITAWVCLGVFVVVVMAL